MIQVVSTSIRDEFEELLSDVRERIRIISPFVGLNTATRLAKLVADTGISGQLITRFSRADFYQGVSSVRGLRALYDAGVRIRAVRNLHAKLFIFDSNALILGSSNLTDGGLIHNLEMNILIQDEQDIIAEAERCFGEIDTLVGQEYDITKDRIDQEIAFLDSLGVGSRSYNRSFQRERDFGANIVPDRFEDAIDAVVGLSGSPSETDSWLKFEGLVENRLPGSERVKRSRIDGVYTTNFPKRPRGAHNGDTIFLSVLSFNSDGRPMPMIVGYGVTEGYNEENEHTADEIRANPLLERFPYFLRVRDLRIVDAPAQDCVSLMELYSNVGNAAFPTTAASPMSPDNLHQLHFRRDKLRLTETAKRYLASRLDGLFSQRGTI